MGRESSFLDPLDDIRGVSSTAALRGASSPSLAAAFSPSSAETPFTRGPSGEKSELLYFLLNYNAPRTNYTQRRKESNEPEERAFRG